MLKPNPEAVPEAPLPDPKRAKGPYRPFSCDPGWDEAWWWLGIPVAMAAFILASAGFAPDFYMQWVLPEGYGFLEVGHFLVPLAAAIIALRLLFKPFMRGRPVTFAFVLFAAVACIYIAGEEHSWGQHFFYWNTPEYWAAVNRQAETNLHNVYTWLNHQPRAVLQAGIFIGGLLVPLAAWFFPFVRRNRWSLFLPAAALVPAALGWLFFRGVSQWNKVYGETLVQRPSESVETFMYLFLLFYMIVFARRIAELEGEARVSSNG
ncbi:MAG: hypothetical protein ACRECX_00895 [Methyloceanibacter sp.]|uniref:hypothetical protein n=1 Tax=Methyloceanibacter sp. TaxID=1965321 RepID=UPI003D6CE4D9